MEYEPCLLLENMQIDWPIPNSVYVYQLFEENVSMYLLARVSQLLDRVSQILARVSQLLACDRVKTGDVGLFHLLIV